MAKKRVSSVDLSWMIFERMRDEVSPQRGLTVAVIPDKNLVGGLCSMAEAANT
jgi:hypothetical protein